MTNMLAILGIPRSLLERAVTAEALATKRMMGEPLERVQYMQTSTNQWLSLSNRFQLQKPDHPFLFLLIRPSQLAMDLEGLKSTQNHLRSWLAIPSTPQNLYKLR